MTKSNNEWVPSVGDEIEVFDTVLSKWNKVEVTGVGHEVFVIRYFSNAESLLSKKAPIRPIKTEAEKRREELIKEFCLSVTACDTSLKDLNDIEKTISERAIDAGWIKPKPLNAQVIRDVWKSSNKSDDIADKLNNYVAGVTYE